MKIPISAVSLSLLTGCLPSPVKNMAPTPGQVRTNECNKRWIVEIQTQPDFKKEDAYVMGRRTATGYAVESDSDSADATGLAFSGGGLRSATINLGVLQGLQERGILKEVDYLSCVSGGAYIGAWFTAHLINKDEKGNPIYTNANPQYASDPDRLLGTGRFDASKSVANLERERGFVYGGRYSHTPMIAAFMAATIPVNVVMDVALHFKPTRGKFNWYHPNFFYEYYIRKTYLSKPSSLLPNQNPLGDFHNGAAHSLALEEINPPGSAAPYLIINCALANGRPATKAWSAETLPFEFSRFSCGSMPLGFVTAADFGFPVEGTYQVNARRYTVLRNNSVANLPLVKPFRLSSAVAASGAALDSSGINKLADQPKQEGEAIYAPVVETKRMWLDFLLKPLNLNLRHQNRNFAMAITETKDGPLSRNTKYPVDWVSPKHDIKDRGREVTKDRFNSTVFSNSLYLSDGAHYENLGIFALTLRPKIREIWCIDAGGDKCYKFGDIIHTQKLLEKAGWTIEWQPNSKGPITGTTGFSDHPWFSKSKRDAIAAVPWDSLPVFKATLTHRGRKSITLYYVKSSYRAMDGIGADAQVFLNTYYHGDWGSFSKPHTNLPHTSTTNLAFSKNDFRAYREIGRSLGHFLSDAQQ